MASAKQPPKGIKASWERGRSQVWRKNCECRSWNASYQRKRKLSKSTRLSIKRSCELWIHNYLTEKQKPSSLWTYYQSLGNEGGRHHRDTISQMQPLGNNLVYSTQQQNLDSYSIIHLIKEGWNSNYIFIPIFLCHECDSNIILFYTNEIVIYFKCEHGCLIYVYSVKGSRLLS